MRLQEQKNEYKKNYEKLLYFVCYIFALISVTEIIGMTRVIILSEFVTIVLFKYAIYFCFNYYY